LVSLPKENNLKAWQKAFPAEIPEGEKLLLMDSALIFKDLHNMPLAVRSVIQEMVKCMSAGMQYYSRLCQRRGQLRLRNLREVNQYCFFVAGIVGEALVQLVTLADPQLKKAQQLILGAQHFGLFLQKINLLKDQMEDEKKGRFFIYNRSEVRCSLGDNARGAWEFFKALPLQQRGFRIFCAHSLFLGVASLPWIDSSFENQKMLKIPRAATQKLFGLIEGNIDNNNFLETLFKDLMKKGDLALTSPLVPVKKERVEKNDDQWFNRFYHGKLRVQEFAALGIKNGLPEC